MPSPWDQDSAARAWQFAAVAQRLAAKIKAYARYLDQEKMDDTSTRS